MPRSPALVLALALLVVACGSGQDTDAPGADSSPTPAGDLGAKPEVVVPEGEGPPDELVVTELAEGDGDQATPGSTLTVHYVGVAWSSGEQFDASWDRAQPFTFELGAGAVIQGWDRGLEGMRTGGRRQLVIPPELAYGDDGAGGVIGPDETLVFVVDLLAVEAPTPGDDQPGSPAAS